MTKNLCAAITKFRRTEFGSSTVESVLWLPIFFALFGLMTDAAMIFNGHSRALRVVQDANRNLSVGRLNTEDDTEAWIVSELASLSSNVAVDTQIVAGIATTTASIPAVDLEILGMFSALNRMTVSITSQHYIEF